MDQSGDGVGHDDENIQAPCKHVEGDGMASRSTKQSRQQESGHVMFGGATLGMIMKRLMSGRCRRKVGSETYESTDNRKAAHVMHANMSGTRQKLRVPFM